MSNPFLKAVNDYSLIEKNDAIAVALSGGADSVSLLHMFYSVKEKYSLTLYAIHINHMIRGEEAERDEEFCKSFCKSLGIELFVKKINVPLLAAEQKISTELCGRNARYNAFDEFSEKLNCKIATAHTLSDNAETLMINLARGTSLHGLCAIPEKRGIIIRPLILCDRKYIEKYCRDNSLDFVTDSTNLTDDYTRNKIRHNVIAELKKINPSFEVCVKRLCDDAKLLSNYIDSCTERELSACRVKFGYSTEKLLSLDKIIRQNAVKKICVECGTAVPEHIHIDLIDKILKSGGSVDLCGDFRAVSKQGIFRIENTKINDNSDIEILFGEVINKSFTLCSNEYSVKEINECICDDKDIISLSDEEIEHAVIRTRKQGDKIFFQDRNITKPLRKAMNEYKIPSEQRDKIPVVAVEDKILWCKGMKLSHKNYSDVKRKFKII